MRRPGADLEEKHEPLGRHLPTAVQTQEKKRNEVRLLLTNAAIEKRTFTSALPNGSTRPLRTFTTRSIIILGRMATTDTGSGGRANDFSRLVGHEQRSLHVARTARTQP